MVNRIQKKVHKLVRYSISFCEGTEYQLINYRQHRIACREELKQYAKSEIIKRSILDLVGINDT